MVTDKPHAHLTGTNQPHLIQTVFCIGSLGFLFPFSSSPSSFSSKCRGESHRLPSSEDIWNWISGTGTVSSLNPRWKDTEKRGSLLPPFKEIKRSMLNKLKKGTYWTWVDFIGCANQFQLCRHEGNLGYAFLLLLEEEIQLWITALKLQNPARALTWQKV